MAERYVVGAFAFAAAATWLGVSVDRGLLCAVAFVAGVQAMRLYQRRAAVRARQSSRRPSARSRHVPAAERRRDEEPDWPLAGEGTW